MIMTMRRRLFAGLLTLSLLIGCLAVGGLLPASGAVVQGASAVVLSAAPAEESLIHGLSPVSNPTSDHSKTVGYQSSLTPLTDGQYPGVNVLVEPVRDSAGNVQNANDNHPEYGIKNNAGDLITKFSCWTNDYIDLTFDLGTSNGITGFAVGSTAEPGVLKKQDVADWTDAQIVDRYKTMAQPALRLFKGEVFIADDPASLFRTDSQAAGWNYSGEVAPLAAQFTLDVVNEGRYVGFRLYIGSGWASLFRIGELAVFGGGDNGFVRGGTVQSLENAPAGINLIRGAEPVANPASDHSKVNAYQGDMAVLTDGKYPGINDPVYPIRDWNGGFHYVNDAHPEYGIQNNASSQVTLFSCWTNDYIDLTFDLGCVRTVTSFAVGSTAEPKVIKMEDALGKTDAQLMEAYKSTANTALRLFKGEFYAAKDAADLFQDATQVTAWDFTGGTTPLAAEYMPEQSVEGRYVGFRLYIGSGWASLFRIGELAVYSKPYADCVTGGAVQPLTAAPGSISLIAGKSPVTDGVPGHGVPAAWAETMSRLTDGRYPGVTEPVRPVRNEGGQLQNVDDAHPEYGILHNAESMVTQLDCPPNGYVDFVFDLGEAHIVDSFALGSTAHPQILTLNRAYTMSDEEILQYFNQHPDTELWLSQGAFYLSETPESLFSDSARIVEWNFAQSEPLQAMLCTPVAQHPGRYVGFRLYGNRTGKLFVGELAVFGESAEALPSLSVSALQTSQEYLAAIAGKNNLLKGSSIPGMTEGYLTHSGSSIVNGMPESALTDGIINWTDSEEETKVVLSREGDSGFASLSYDLRGTVQAECLMIANSARETEACRIKQVWVYASDEPGALYSRDNLKGVAELHPENIGSRIDLSGVDVRGRYIGIRIPAGAGYPLHGYARLTEIGLYGVYSNPGNIRPMAENLLTQDGPALVDCFAIDARGIHNRTAVDVHGNPGQENLGEIPVGEQARFWREDDTAKLTDGSVDTLCSMNSYGAPDAVNGNILNYNNPWFVYIYYLGGNARLSSVSLISTAEANLNISGVQFYASRKYADLFRNESLLFTSGGEYFIGNEEDGYLPDATYELTEQTVSYDLTDEQYADTYRYVAFVVTRPFPMYRQGTDQPVAGYNIARIAELQAMGIVESPEAPLKTSFEVQTGLGKATVNIAPLNFDDREFFENIGRVTITEETISPEIKKTIANHWLTLAVDTAYRVRVFDRTGKPVTEGEGLRDVEVVFPVDPGVTWMSGRIKDGQIQRLYNGNTRMDGTLRAGENAYPVYDGGIPNNRAKATIQDLDFSVVLLKYNDKKTIFRLNGAVENTPITEFFGTEVAGVSRAAEEPRRPAPLLWGLLSLLPLSAAAYLLARSGGKSRETKGGKD